MATQVTMPQGIARIKKFLKEVRSELRKVAWPKRQEILSYTSVVFVTVSVVAALIWALDLAFNRILKLIF
jgi:preprotein translocase subunit SecE